MTQWVDTKAVWLGLLDYERTVMCSFLGARDRLSALPEHAVAKNAIEREGVPLSRDRVRVALARLVTGDFLELEEAPHDPSRPVHYRYWLSRRGLALMQSIYPERFDECAADTEAFEPTARVEEALDEYVRALPELEPTDVFLPLAFAEAWKPSLEAQLVEKRAGYVRPFEDSSAIEFRCTHGRVRLWAANVPSIRVFGRQRRYATGG